MSARSPFPAALDPLQPSDPPTVGPYRVVGRLGAGGMGAVYGALDAADRCLAVKLVHREFAENDEFRARFAREVRLVERVRARCTPAFMGADAEADTPWLATEYVPGPTLREHVNAEGPLSEGMLLALAAGLAEALHAIHSAGVVHRDLKPSNVILAPDGPKVLDFGIARALDGTGLTRTGGIMGSPGWIAPERYHGEEATPAADIFAWGGLVAFAATGRAPFGTGTPQVVAARTLRELPDTSDVPSAIRPLVNRALSRAPETRPDLIDALAALGPGTNSTIPNPPPETVAGTLIDAEWRDLPPSRHDPREWTAHATRRKGRGKWLLAGAMGLAASVASFVAIQADQEEGPNEENPTTHSPESPETPNSTPIPANITGQGEFTADNPGIYRQSINEVEVLHITMESMASTDTHVTFEGTANYLADTGSIEFGTGNFYVATGTTTDPADGQTWISEPGEIFGVLSAQHPDLDFSLVVPTDTPDLPGTLVYNTDGAQTDPHLCYRTEPYAETGTQFLHNAGDSWQDCAADRYE